VTDSDFNEENVNNQITKLLQAYEQTATSSNICGSFRLAGMDLI
jgi:hypothetical protein